MTNDTGGPAFPKVVRSDWTEIDHGMSLRQYAAIALRVPNSGTDWLDEMIREARREDCAAKAMQAMVAAHIKYNRDPRKRGGDDPLFDYATPDCESILEDREANTQIIAKTAYNVADAMLAARSEKEGE